MVQQKLTQKWVRFDFFELVIENKDGSRGYFQIADWISILPKKLSGRNINLGNIIRCDDARSQVSRSLRYEYLHFTKLRDADAPAVATLNNVDLEDVHLASDEYIAEDISMIFDESNAVIMLQRNRYSLGVSALEAYINYFWEKSGTRPETTIRILPIFHKPEFSKVQRAKRISKFSFRTAGLRDGNTTRNPFSGSLQKIMSDLTKYQGYNVSLTVSVGRHTSQSLNNNEIKKLVEDVQLAGDDIQSADVSFVDQNDISNKLDLIDAKMSSFILFEVPRKESLRKDAVEVKMIEEYFPAGKNMRQTVISDRA